MAIKRQSNNKEGKPMDADDKSARPNRSRAYLSKLKHPSSFSRPQLAVFILAFAIIGYLLIKAFAAAPLIASLEAENMTPSLPIPTQPSTSTINIGETNITSLDDSGNANTLLAQSTKLGQTATIQSLSFYVTTAAGNLRLGIYDASGTGGGPGKLLASTSEITPVAGWNPANVTTPVTLNAGTYWLAYLPSSGSLAFRKAQDSTSSGKYYAYTYGTLPTTFSTSPSSTASHWSFYATLNVNAIMNIGETNILSKADDNNANTLLAQSTNLGQSATIQSLSFYVRVAGGNLRLGIYDSSGPNGGPGKLMASTNEIAPTSVGWDTASVTTPASLNPGKYWLAYLPSSNTLGFFKTQDSTSSGVFHSYTYGPMPSTFSSSPGKTPSHWSFYATLNGSASASSSASTVTDSTASGGKAEKFSAGVSINGTVSLPSAGSSINVIAHGEQCSTGGWPTMTVSLDGTQVLSASVSSSSWTNYSVAKSMTAGSHSLTITNTSSGSCTPNLYADVTNFFGTVAPPTVSITASPASITSGSSSNLSWSATNANSCAGTGFNTGNATSGSLSVSPTSSTTYTISCMGDGGSVTQTAAVTVTAATSSINIGETNILPNGDSGNANTLLAQSTSLSQTATIQSLSFYVTTAAGNLRLGLYDASGPNGGPGKLLASTNEVATSVGWDTANVASPVSLNAGTYWLAYLASDNNLAFRKNQDSTSSGRYYSYTYGPMPSTFSTSSGTTASHWSFYATLNTSGAVTPPPPPPPPSPPPTGTIYFDGRAKNMTSLLSTGSYTLGTLVQSQSPNLWTGLAFNNNSITLQSDPTFGKIYKYVIGPGNYNPYNTAAANESDASGELSTRHPGNSLGTTDYYSFAVMVPSGWQNPDWSDTVSFGYQTAAWDENTVAIESNNGVPTWDFYGNAGYVNCPTTTCAGSTYHDRSFFLPVTFNQWAEFSVAIKWSTSMDGFIKVYERPVGGTWKQYVDLENTDTLLYGTTENGTISQNMTSTWLDKQDLYYGYWNTALRSWPTETIYHSGLVRASDMATAQSTLP